MPAVLGFRAAMATTISVTRTGWYPITGAGVWTTSSPSVPSLYQSNVVLNNGIFTAPVAGYYALMAQIRLYVGS